MSLFKKFLKKPEKKSAISNLGMAGFINNLMYQGFDNLSSYVAIRYYQSCAPLNAAIDMIAEEFCGINVYLYDKQEKDYTDNHPILDLLQYPNADKTGTEFMKEVVAYLLITGNAYIVASGNVNREPVELYVVPSQYVTLQPGRDGYTETITVTFESNRAEVFKRQEVRRRFRYYSGDDREIWHIRDFNPKQSANDLYGMSNLTPIFYEIEQYIEASIHNASLLKRGARVSGALQSDNNLTDEQFMRLQEQVNNFYSGSDNAGRPLLLEAGMNFTEMSMNNKDMDFLELKKNVTYMIYNALKIPLPLISPEHSTLSNMEIAKLNLYDNAILPIARRIYTELSIFLLPRYRRDNELTRYCLSYSPGEITALEPRRNDELNKLNELGILTINELRAKIGYEPLEGGDSVLSRFNQTTVATDNYTEDQPDKPAPRNQKEFIESLKKHRNEKGVRIYSDNYIKKLMERYGG